VWGFVAIEAEPFTLLGSLIALPRNVEVRLLRLGSGTVPFLDGPYLAAIQFHLNDPHRLPSKGVLPSGLPAAVSNFQEK
jgi:hypothetical protein